MVWHPKRTAEHVGRGHPDKVCDQVADKILDESLRVYEGHEGLRYVRTAIECLVKGCMLLISGEVQWPDRLGHQKIDIDRLARDVWQTVGYPSNEHLTVINHIQAQSADISRVDLADGDEELGTGTNQDGAGDQGVMIGFATDQTSEFMPREYVLARKLILTLDELRCSGRLPWVKSDCKSQVTLDGDRVTSVILAVQHADYDDSAYGGRLENSKDLVAYTRHELFERVIRPVLEEAGYSVGKPVFIRNRFECGELEGAINGTGKFVIGGPPGDAGVVGRKIVNDAYGPRVPVGGGAYSGKDPTKVDRSGAYICRWIAKTVVAYGIGGAKECTVTLAYGIGQKKPEMMTAITQDGTDVSEWVNTHFPDLTPRSIIDDHLHLLSRDGWSFFETACFGHYGRLQFPWERIPESV